VLALIRALADSGVDLAHGTARMAASEGRIVLHRLTVRAGLLLAGLLAASTGLLLCLGGAALLLASASGMETWLALVLVGVLAASAGTAAALRAIRRLGEPDLAFPATLAELEADVEALRGGVAGDGDGGETP
jgi:membrane protein implicated in regulation of membrane protease activity